MKFIKNIFFVFSFILTFNAHALVLVEPHVGYNIIGLGQDSNTPAKTFKYNGGQLGLKLGAQYMGGMAGIDYTRSSFEQLTSGYENSFTRKEWGMFIGYNVPSLARLWLTYYFSNSSRATTSSSLITTGDKYEGHTFEIGGGYSGIPYISINLLLRFITFNKYIGRTSTTSLTGNNEVSNHELVLSVSAPFDFLK